MRIRNVLFTTFMMLMAFDSTLPAVDILYVTLRNDTIVSYDTSSGVAANILATKAIFASCFAPSENGEKPFSSKL